MHKGKRCHRIYGMKNITLYHGTDLDAAELILKEKKFVWSPNKEHWLGNGFYFYDDLSLAKWWTTKPTKKFGIKINKPAILKCEITYNEEEICDLGKYEDYNFFLENYFDYYEWYLKNGPKERVNYKTHRCAYCDFFKDRFGYEMLIGNFYLPDQPYLSEHYPDFVKAIGLPYIEKQYCVYENELITDIQIITGRDI